jgi:protein-S-isoprenylcysteine O-methyltransferase Ste14
MSQSRLLKAIDLPPLWLTACLFLTWWIKHNARFGLSFGATWPQIVGGCLILAGAALMALAIFEMRRQRTTVVPHRTAAKLVTTGIFARSRNPIYLGDTLVLLGVILYWDALLALALVPVFIGILKKRFILPEEQRLTAKFPENFAKYCQEVRRWV